MNKLQGTFTGERALYDLHDAQINNSIFEDGESPLKEGSNYTVNNSTFRWKYPMWYSHDVMVNDCQFELMSRSGIWYTNNVIVNNCQFDAPKMFRCSSGITINNCNFSIADETLWKCEDITITNSYFKGDYLLMNSKNIFVDHLKLDGNYFVDGAKNVEVHNSYLNSKDSFWNCENVEIYDSTIIGEYFGWNSKNVKLVNCHIDGIQSFCYMENLEMINCTTANCNLAFEYTSGNVEVKGKLVSLKNPKAGTFVIDEIEEEVILDPKFIDLVKVKVVIKNEI